MNNSCLVLSYIWKAWNIDPCEQHLLGTWLCMEGYEIKNEMDFELHLLPVTNIKMLWYLLQMLMPKKSVTFWKDMDFDEYFLPWKFMKYMAPGDFIGQMSITEYFSAWVLVKSSHANDFKASLQICSYLEESCFPDCWKV